MDIAGSVALVTGAGCGLGARFATELLDRGASKVYATARKPASVTVPGVEVLALDLLDPSSIAAAAAAAQDVTLLVNNAGVSTGQNLVRGDPAEVRRELETNFFGILAVTRAFADVLAANGGGAIVNVFSALSFFSWDGVTSYCASKAAEWSQPGEGGWTGPGAYVAAVWDSAGSVLALTAVPAAAGLAVGRLIRKSQATHPPE